MAIRIKPMVDAERVAYIIKDALEDRLPEGYWPYRHIGISDDGQTAEVGIDTEVGDEAEGVFVITVKRI